MIAMIGKDEHPNFKRDPRSDPAPDDGVGFEVVSAGGRYVGSACSLKCHMGAVGRSAV